MTCLLAGSSEQEREDGEGKVTPLELFWAGVIELELDVLEFIRAAA